MERTRPSDREAEEKETREEQAAIPAAEAGRGEGVRVEIPAEMLFLEAELIATLLRESGTRR